MKQSTSKHKLPLVKTLAVALVVAVLGLVGYAKFHRNTPVAATQSAQSAKVSATVQTPPEPAAATATPQPVAHADAGLQQAVDAWAAKYSFGSAVVVQELSGDLRTAQHRPDTQMTTASTYKIYIAYAVLHSIEQGTYTLDTHTRTGQTVQAALNKMILQSDNTSAEALGFLVGWDRINALAASVGATRTDINNYNSAGVAANGVKLSTAGDLTTMASKLQQGTLLNAANTQLLLGLMKTQVWRERIPSGVPSGIVVADKPGWLSNVQNDAAIVYGPKSTYTLVVMTSGSSTKPLAELSRLVYDYLQT